MIDVKKLNSATKYPSILTYHEMGDRGRLNPKVQVPFADGREIFVTEKVDGTNGRIVVLPDPAPILHHGPRRWLIGSREELLTAQHDLVYPPDYGIVEALRPIAEALPAHKELVQVWFFEVFGGDLPASKQYSNAKRIAVRLFDQASIPLAILDMPIDKIASWRDHGGQAFADEAVLALTETVVNAERFSLARVPALGRVTSIPTSIEATYEWLKPYAKSSCDLGGGNGRSEGVVVRAWDRSPIAKLRFEDYERTLGVKR